MVMPLQWRRCTVKGLSLQGFRFACPKKDHPLCILQSKCGSFLKGLQ